MGLDSRRISPEGLIACAGSFTGWLYMAKAHWISSGFAWVLFLLALASFILSIFASIKQSRWWFTVTLVAFALLLYLVGATEGCTGSPCPI